MRYLSIPKKLHLFCLTALALTSAPSLAFAQQTGGVYPRMGDTSRCGNANATAFSTVACPGNSPTATKLNIVAGTFNDNPSYSKCVKIDNATNKSYFIPLKTYREWIAFYNAARSPNSNLGLSVSDCSASSPPPAAINGDCNTAITSATWGSQPTGVLCSSGTATTVSGTGAWNWSCLGANGGTTANCSAAYQCVPDGTLTSTPTGGGNSNGGWQGGGGGGVGGGRWNDGQGSMCPGTDWYDSCGNYVYSDPGQMGCS